MVFTDVVTVYKRQEQQEEVNGIISTTYTWTRTVIEGVMWTDKSERVNNDGKISIAKYATITFPEGAFEKVDLLHTGEEDAIVYGEIEDEVTAAKGNRLSDLINKYPKSGRIKQVKDNSTRDYLKHIKVVVA